jgi:DNA-binding IclR family transcriptional regulator
MWLGSSSVAAPILVSHDHKLLAVAAVSIICPTARVRRDNGATLSRFALAAAGRIAEDLTRPAPF